MATEMPDTRAMSDKQLVDALGELRETIKTWSAQEKYFSTALKARFPTGGMAEGATYNVSVTEQSQSRLDTDKIRKDMSLEWIEEHSKSISFQKLSVDRRGDG